MTAPTSPEKLVPLSLVEKLIDSLDFYKGGEFLNTFYTTSEFSPEIDDLILAKLAKLLREYPFPSFKFSLSRESILQILGCPKISNDFLIANINPPTSAYFFDAFTQFPPEFPSRDKFFAHYFLINCEGLIELFCYNAMKNKYLETVKVCLGWINSRSKLGNILFQFRKTPEELEPFLNWIWLKGFEITNYRVELQFLRCARKGCEEYHDFEFMEPGCGTYFHKDCFQKSVLHLPGEKVANKLVCPCCDNPVSPNDYLFSDRNTRFGDRHRLILPEELETLDLSKENRVCEGCLIIFESEGEKTRCNECSEKCLKCPECSQKFPCVSGFVKIRCSRVNPFNSYDGDDEEEKSKEIYDEEFCGTGWYAQDGKVISNQREISRLFMRNQNRDTRRREKQRLIWKGETPRTSYRKNSREHTFQNDTLQEVEYSEED